MQNESTANRDQSTQNGCEDVSHAFAQRTNALYFRRANWSSAIHNTVATRSAEGSYADIRMTNQTNRVSECAVVIAAAQHQFWFYTAPEHPRGRVRPHPNGLLELLREPQKLHRRGIRYAVKEP